MSFQKENIEKSFSKVFGIKFSPAELEQISILAEERKLTPIKHGASVLFSPVIAESLVKIALNRNDFSVKDKRFKKIIEEIVPAIDFVLFLKLLGMGEYLLLSGDVPDIILVKLKDIQDRKLSNIHKIPAIPLEVTFIKATTLQGISGVNDTEKVANAIISGKFSKAYNANTSLLVVLDATLGMFSLKDLSSYILNKKHCFNSIWIYMQSQDGVYVIAQLYPVLKSREFDLERDLRPLMY